MFLLERVSIKKGFALTSVLVAIGIGGIVAVAMMTLNENALRSAKYVEISTDITEVRQYILKAASCDQTFPGGIFCTSDSPVELLNDKGKVIVGKPSQKFGKVEIKAFCNSGRLHIQVPVLEPNGVFSSSSWRGISRSFLNGYDFCPFGGSAVGLKQDTCRFSNWFRREKTQAWIDSSPVSCSVGEYVAGIDYRAQTGGNDGIMRIRCCKP